MFFSSALSALYALLFGGGFSWKAIQITGGWFGGSYLMLMLLSPILNAGISALGREGKLLWGMGGFVLGVVAFWMPANLMTGIAPHMVGSVSFFSMMFIYMVARSVRELNDRYDLKRWAYCGVMIYPVGLAVAVLIACMAAKMQGRVINYGVISHYTSSYLAPHNVLIAISVLLIFLTRLRLPRMVERVGAFLAPSMFSVYLLHHTTSFGRCLYQGPQRYLVGHCAWHPMFAILCTVLMTFCVCLILDFIRRALLWAGRKIWCYG